MAASSNETNLTTIGNDRYLRYILLVGQSGTEILRAILMRDLGPDFYNYIKDHKSHLKMKKEKIQRVFSSSDNTISDINTWDISILSDLILQLCKRKTPRATLDNIVLIKNVRNELAHPDTFSLDEDTYLDDCNRAAGILMTLCTGLDRSIKDRCQNLVENCKSGQMNRQAALEVLAEIRKYDRKISDLLENLTERVEVLTGQSLDEEKVNVIQKGIEELKQVVKEYIEEGNAECRSFVVLESRLTLKGRDVHLTALAEEALERVFKIANIRIKGDKNVSELTIEVRKLLDEIETFEGVTFCGADQQCIKVKMKCENYRGLIELLDYLQSDAFRKRLTSLVEVLEKEDGTHYQITFELDSESIRSIRSAIVGEHRQMSVADRKYRRIRPSVIYERKTDSEETERLKLVRPDAIGSENVDQELDVSLARQLKPDIYVEDTEVSNVLRKNKVLLDEIADTADIIGDEDHVILLIGQIGAGKSSLINTLHKILTERYFIIAPQGRGVTQSVTTELIRYDKCGTTLNLIESIPDGNKKDKLKRIFKKLPQIIDFAGLGNVNTPELTEILELLIGGFLPTRTTFAALEQCQKDFGIGALKLLFPKAKPNLQVTKIIFLHSFRDAFPDKLIQCLNGVLKNYQETKLHLKCKPDVFILATKFDLVRNKSLHSPDATDSLEASLEKFKNVEKRLSEELHISERSFRWISFHDGLNTDSEYVENLALKFLKCILQPGIPCTPQPDGIGLMQKANLRAFKIKQRLKQFLSQDIQLTFTRANFLAALVCLLIAIILALWFVK